LEKIGAKVRPDFPEAFESNLALTDDENTHVAFRKMERSSVVDLKD
jgi:hypothetical protein